MRIFLVLCLTLLSLASCTKANTDSSNTQETNGDPSLPENKSAEPKQQTDVVIMMTAISAPPGDGGGSIGGQWDGVDASGNRAGGEIKSVSYRNRPAIWKGLVTGPGDLDRYVLLALMLRDSELDVHVAAAKALRDKFGVPVLGSATNAGRLLAYDKAMQWWATNKDELVWSDEESKFVVGT